MFQFLNRRTLLGSLRRINAIRLRLSKRPTLSLQGVVTLLLNPVAGGNVRIFLKDSRRPYVPINLSDGVLNSKLR